MGYYSEMNSVDYLALEMLHGNSPIYRDELKEILKSSKLIKSGANDINQRLCWLVERGFIGEIKCTKRNMDLKNIECCLKMMIDDIKGKVVERNIKWN